MSALQSPANPQANRRGVADDIAAMVVTPTAAPVTAPAAAPQTAAPQAAAPRAAAAQPAAPVVAVATPENGTQRATRYVLAGLRLALGWVFLWAFLDKLFGLGHETTTSAAWINGGSPTQGFLANGTQGPFTDFYHSIAGAGWANWLFMVGLAAIGLALITGVGMRIAAAAGALMMVMMWTAVLPPANNLFMDDHLIYAGVLIALALTRAGDTFGLGRWWAATPLVRSAPYLR